MHLMAQQATILHSKLLRLALGDLVLSEESAALHLEALKLVPNIYISKLKSW